jgi:hypothetical protein
MKVTVEVEVELLGYDGKQSIPAFWEGVGTVKGAPFEEVGRSMFNPFVFLLMAGETGEKGPNGGYLGSVICTGMFEQIADKWDELVADAQAEADKEGAHYGDVAHLS